MLLSKINITFKKEKEYLYINGIENKDKIFELKNNDIHNVDNLEKINIISNSINNKKVDLDNINNENINIKDNLKNINDIKNNNNIIRDVKINNIEILKKDLCLQQLKYENKIKIIKEGTDKTIIDLNKQLYEKKTVNNNKLNNKDENIKYSSIVLDRIKVFYFNESKYILDENEKDINNIYKLKMK